MLLHRGFDIGICSVVNDSNELFINRAIDKFCVNALLTLMPNCIPLFIRVFVVCLKPAVFTDPFPWMFSSFHRLAGHLSQCEEYLEYKEYGIEEAPYYRLPMMLARQQKWRNYWMDRSDADQAITLTKRRILRRKIKKHTQRRWRGVLP